MPNPDPPEGMRKAREMPVQSLAVIDSAYKFAISKYPDMNDRENFLNGFLFGMRWGLGLGGLSRDEQALLLKAFTGEL